jgi:hypothetical protein
MKVNFSPDIGQHCRDLSNRDLCNPLLFVVKQMHWVGNIQLWRCFTFELSTIAWSECNGSLNCSVPISKDWISQHFVQQFQFSFLFCVIYNLVVTLLYRTYYSNMHWTNDCQVTLPKLSLVSNATTFQTQFGHDFLLHITLYLHRTFVDTCKHFGKD